MVETKSASSPLTLLGGPDIPDKQNLHQDISIVETSHHRTLLKS